MSARSSMLTPCSDAMLIAVCRVSLGCQSRPSPTSQQLADAANGGAGAVSN